MKKISTFIACLSLSLLTIGAMAQIPVHTLKGRSYNPVPVKGKIATVINHSTKNHSTKNPLVVQNYLADNLAGDIFKNPLATFFSWSGPDLYLNNAFDNTDTLASNNANFVMTVFDTLFDGYTNNFISIAGQPVSVDTIYLNIMYHNTSGGNDTMFVYVTSVDANGYPSTTTYGGDSVIIHPGDLPYNNLDSVQYLTLPNPISIPTSARHGWNFAIWITVHAPKNQDTIALVYYSQGGDACTAIGGYYTPEPTSIGVPNGAVNCVNTFEEGMWAYNSPGNGGDGTELEWPETTGSNQGYYGNQSYLFYPVPLSLVSTTCTGDTAQFAIQDVAIFPTITTGTATGINNNTSSGLSVGQNYPNPFNKTTQIAYSLAKSSDVTFSVYDMTGRVLVNNVYTNSTPGQHIVSLSANSLSPGVYFYTFNVNGSKVTKKMVITE